MTDIHAVITELKALEAKATKGKWGTSVYDWMAEHPRLCVHDGGNPPYAMCIMDAATDDDAALIAASRNALSQLLAYIERLEAVASAARGVVRTDDIAGNGEWSHMLKCIAALDTLERDE